MKIYEHLRIMYCWNLLKSKNILMSMILLQGFLTFSTRFSIGLDLNVFDHITDHHSNVYEFHQHENDFNLISHKHHQYSSSPTNVGESKKSDSNKKEEHTHYFQTNSDGFWVSFSKFLFPNFDSFSEEIFTYEDSLNIQDFNSKLFRPPQVA